MIQSSAHSRCHSLERPDNGIAAIYALLDHADHIGPAHLAAASALVHYSIASAQAVLSPNETVTRLAAWIAEAGPEGRTRKDVTVEFFGGNAKRAGVDPARLLDQLVQSGRIERITRPPASGRGRPTEVYRAQPGRT